MSAMDLIAIAWFEDMYQKLEANTVPIYKESIKYVEDQVETVGACVEKFYLDLMQSSPPLLANEPVVPVRPGSQSLHCAVIEIADKSELDINGKDEKGGSENLSSDSYIASESCNLSNTLESSAEELTLSSNKDESEEPSEKLVLKETHTEDDGELCNEMDECHEVDESVVSTSTISSSYSPTTGVAFGNGENVSKWANGMSYEQVSDEIEQQLHEVKLDESCVLVDKHEHSSVSHLDSNKDSYKKKIKDVFYLKRWSRSKNQEQLNTINEDADSPNQESRKTMVTASTLESCNTNLQNNSLLSGWEIL